MTVTQTKVNEAIEQMATDPDIKTLVREIEAGIPTTKGHYGRYMAFLSNFNDVKIAALVIAPAMIKAGANAYGVNWAVKLIRGDSY